MGRPSVALERREQIVWGLYECLTQSDFAQVTVKDIAQKAEVAPGILHHYFTGKDEIYGALARSILEQYETRLDHFLKGRPAAANRRQAALEFIVDEFVLDRSLNRVFYNLILKSLTDSTIRVPLQALLDRYRDRLHDEFDPAAGLAIVAQIEGLALQHLVDPERFSRADFLTVLTNSLRSHEETT